MPGKELDRRTEIKAAEVAVRYAGFVTVDSLSNAEKVMSLVSLIPMALEVVDEARDTIERLNDENEILRAEIARLKGDTPA